MRKDKGDKVQTAESLFTDYRHPGRRATDDPETPNQEVPMRNGRREGDEKPAEGIHVSGNGCIVVTGGRNKLYMREPESTAATNDNGDEGSDASQQMIQATQPHDQAMNPHLYSGMKSLHEFFMLLNEIKRR